MRKLLIPKHVFDQVLSIVLGTPEGLETGVTLFGTSVAPVQPRLLRNTGGGDKAASNRADVVLAVAGPGRRATHEPAHYSGDENYSNAVFDALESALPGIRWLGELHVHPKGMIWLSHGDQRTVRQVLTGQDNTLHPEEFIAGVMQRRNGSVDIYPYHFTRECLKGSAMELLIVESDAPLVQQARQKGIENDRPCICTKPAGSREAGKKAPGHRRLRQWRERLSRYGGSLWLRAVHPRRSRNA